MIMGLITWIAIIAIVLVAIGLGAGVFFSGLFRGAEIVGESIRESDTVNQAQEEVGEFVEQRAEDETSGGELVLTTSEATYDKGQPTVFTVKNAGETTLSFPDTSYGLKIEDADGTDYSVPAAQVITELGPGDSNTITWDEDAPSGDYTATVSTVPEDNESASVTFKIR